MYNIYIETLSVFDVPLYYLYINIWYHVEISLGIYYDIELHRSIFVCAILITF